MPTSAEWVAAGTPAPDAASAPDTTAEPTTTTAPATETPAAQPGITPATEAEIEALEAWLDEKGEKKLSIPLTARIPWEQRGKKGYSTLKEIQQAHLFHRDYTPKMQRLAEDRKALERSRKEIELDRAAIAAERQVIQDELTRYKAALGDPAAMERLAADQDRLQNDPEYRKLVEDAIAKRVGDATQARSSELEAYDYSTEVADGAAEYISTTAAQYPGVNPDEVRQYFADALSSGRLTIGPAPDQFNARTVDRYFQQAAKRLEEAAAPFRKEAEELRQRLAKLEAEQKNGAVVAGLRATSSAANGAPPTSRPQTGSDLPPPKPGETREQRSRAWARG